MVSDLRIGIDLGGTNLKIGIVDLYGNVIHKTSVPTGCGPDFVVGSIVATVNTLMKRAGVGMNQIATVGIALPGLLSTRKGVVIRCANLPGWDGVPLCDLISKALRKPVAMENDGRAAAFGEYRVGAGRTSPIRNMVMLTLGTGVGSGIILDGRLVQGHAGRAGEFGHSIVKLGGELCGCGQKGCLEVYAAASRVHNRALRALENSSAESSLRSIDFRHGAPTSSDVVEHALSGDPLAMQIWDETCRYIAVGCVNAAHLTDPEVIVLGGGMAAAGDFLLRGVTRHFREQYWNVELPRADIRITEAGNDAGLIGAALLAGEVSSVTMANQFTENIKAPVVVSLNGCPTENL